MSYFMPEFAPSRFRALAWFLLAALIARGPCTAQAQRKPHASPHAPVPTATTEPREEWVGLYIGQKKVGYSVSRTSSTMYQEKPALRESSHSVTRLMMLGVNVEEDEVSEAITDLNHRPLKQVLDVTSNGSGLHIEAMFDYKVNTVFCTVGAGPGATHKTLIIPPGANLTADTNTLTEGQDLSVGKKLKFYYLQPLSVKLMPAVLEVTGKTVVRADSGAQVPAFEVKVKLQEGDMVGWAGRDGSFVRSEMRLGPITMTMVRETKPHALDTAYLSPALAPAAAGAAPTPADFADATALKPDRQFADPRRLRYLKATISGVPEQNLLPSDARQAWIRGPGVPGEGVTADFTVRAERFDATEASQWPVQDKTFARYLGKAAFLDTDDPAIQQTARELRGKETNLYKIAARIRDWVHSVMTPDASIGVIRSAKDVYGRRRGVCRDYATLYTAIARSAGVPTRLCAGIVYADGKFFYHAWAESFVGRWVAFDPTLYSPGQASYVDATHIKFAQGDANQMFEVVSIVGRLKIHVVESEPAAQGAEKVLLQNSSIR